MHWNRNVLQRKFCGVNCKFPLEKCKNTLLSRDNHVNFIISYRNERAREIARVNRREISFNVQGTLSMSMSS